MLLLQAILESGSSVFCWLFFISQISWISIKNTMESSCVFPFRFFFFFFFRSWIDWHLWWSDRLTDSWLSSWDGSHSEFFCINRLPTTSSSALPRSITSHRIRLDHCVFPVSCWSCIFRTDMRRLDFYEHHRLCCRYLSKWFGLCFPSISSVLNEATVLQSSWEKDYVESTSAIVPHNNYISSGMHRAWSRYVPRSCQSSVVHYYCSICRVPYVFLFESVC